ncbi:hypothetical protein Tco_1071899 [Tanacetum coccineum]
MYALVVLYEIDRKYEKAFALYVNYKDFITPAEVVSQLLAAKNECDSSYFLYEYLHALSEVNPHTGRYFQDMQTLDILYYGVLDIPLPELEGSKTLNVTFHDATKNKVSAEL